MLNESLRVYPIVTVNSREAVVDTTLRLEGDEDGNSPMFVRKGQTVTWSTYAMHRRKDYYGEDADEYKPERWLGPNGLRPGWEVRLISCTALSRNHGLTISPVPSIQWRPKNLHRTTVRADRGLIHDDPLGARVQEYREQRSWTMGGVAYVDLRGSQWLQSCPHTFFDLNDLDASIGVLYCTHKLKASNLHYNA